MAYPARMFRMLAAVAAAGLLAACSSSSGSASSETAFIRHIRQNAAATAAGTQALLIELQGPGSDVQQTGASAQALHDHLAGFYDDTVAAADVGDDRELSVGAAIGELRDATGAVARWSTDQSGASAQAAADQLTQAVSDWDSAVAALWSHAKAGSAPTI